MIIKKINNVTDLRDNLISQYEALALNKLDVKKSKEMSNSAGKILASAKVQLEQKTLLRDRTPIKFLLGD